MFSLILENFEPFEISYGIIGNKDNNKISFEPRTRTHRIHLTNLYPDSDIWFEIILNNTKTERICFHTPPAPESKPVDKFAIIGDPHVSVNRENYNGRLLEESTSILAETLKDITKRGITKVLIPGDITDYGKEQEYQVLTEILGSFDGEIYLVPGDHDLEFTPKTSFLSWNKHLNNYQKFFFSELDHFIMVGLDTSKGILDSNQQKNVTQKLKTVNPAKPVFMITHFPLIDNPYLRDEVRTASNAPKLMKWLMDISNPCVIFAGHRNVFSISKEQSTWQVSTPQTVQYPCAYLIGSLHPTSINLQIMPIHSNILYHHSRQECLMCGNPLLEPSYRSNSKLAGYCQLELPNPLKQID